MKNKLLPFLFFGLPIIGQAQVDNYCLRLANDGQVDCGCMPELNAAKNYSLQFWMNAEEWTPGATLLSRGQQLQIRLGQPNQMQLVLGDEIVTFSNRLLVPGKWLQFTLIVSSEHAKVLLNNQVIFQKDGIFELPVESQNFVVGNQYHGRIDEVRVWNTALDATYDYFVNNTLNKWVPQLEHLVAYYKFDQEKCANVVDYKALFQPAEYNHHGVMSATGAVREKVTDNPGLPYLLCGGYTNINRFFDRAIDRDRFLLSNDLIILGIQSYPDGHLKYAAPNDHATLGEGVERLTAFAGRRGVLSLSGKGGLTTTTDVLVPVVDANGKATKGFTFETWLYLEKWTPGAYLFNKRTAEGKGFSISLGDEATHQVIVRVNEHTYVSQSPLELGKWMHFAVSTNGGDRPEQTFLFAYDGVAQWADASLSSEFVDFTPVGMEQTVATIGEGWVGKLDETVIWNEKYNIEQIQQHRNGIAFPGIGKAFSAQTYLNSSACYLYDDEDHPGWDSFSMDEWKNRMLSAYEGYRGYQVRISVMGHKGWQNTIANAAKRKIFAQDLAALSAGYAGVELDLEWMDGAQTHLGNLAREIRAVLPKEKSLRVSCHAYGAYKFPVKEMAQVDGFTFQQYGPQKTWFNLKSFTDSYNNFVKYGFPKDKIYLSFATTTSAPYNAADQKLKGGISGWRNVIKENGYTPSDNMGFRKAKVGDNFYYYYQSPEQVYKRARFVVDNHLQGIFYWDMGNDINTAEEYSISKYCSYGLNSNVDTLVTQVTVNTPTGIAPLADAEKPVTVHYDAALQTITLLGGQHILAVEVYSLSGKKLAASVGRSLPLHQLGRGTYLVVPVTANGKQPGVVFLKK